MARLVGIDVRGAYVRAAVLQSQYRGYKLTAYRQAQRGEDGDIVAALQSVLGPLVQAGDHLCCCLAGDKLFMRDITLPQAAQKQLGEVVPYEVEAQVPLDISDLCFDYRVVPSVPARENIDVLAAAARISDVRQQIDLISEAVGREPEKVAAGALPLGNLALVVSELSVDDPVALLDLGVGRSDLVIVQAGVPVFARTLSVGADSRPAALIAGLRQSRAAWLQRGGPDITRVYLSGAGADAPGACSLLSEALELAVSPLPKMNIEAAVEVPGALVGFEKAISLALGVSSAAKDLNLRKGPLAFQHSYEFLKTKVGVLGGLFAAVVLSFVFSIWAEGRSLDAENAVLAARLAAATKGAVDEAIEDPEQVLSLLDRGAAGKEQDPQPELDAFGALIAVTESVPDEIIHDIEEFDVQGDKLKLVGIVSETGEAERIAALLGSKRCFTNVKVDKYTKMIKSDRQKYSLSLTIDCEKPADKKLAVAAEAEAK